MTKDSFRRWFETRGGWFARWGGMEFIVASILSVAIISLGSGMFGSWIKASREGGYLPISLNSMSNADYSVDSSSSFVPAIGLEIIEDLLGFDNPLNQEEGMVGNLPATPTPPPGEVLRTATPTGTTPPSASPTNRPTGIPPTPSFTSTTTPMPTDDSRLTPTWTKSPPLHTKTPTLSPTPRLDTQTPIPTSTPLTPTDNPTFTPTPSPFLSPTHTPTFRPTHSRTQALTPTSQYTPGVTIGSPTIP